MMSENKWELIFYKTKNGKIPTVEFIRGLPDKLKAKALKDLELLETYGNDLTMSYSRAMGNGLFELRILQSNNIARIFYFFREKNRIILTNGFIKKTQQTPPRELEKAFKYKQEYEQREAKNEPE